MGVPVPVGVPVGVPDAGVPVDGAAVEDAASVLVGLLGVDGVAEDCGCEGFCPTGASWGDGLGCVGVVPGCGVCVVAGSEEVGWSLEGVFERVGWSEPGAAACWVGWPLGRPALCSVSDVCCDGVCWPCWEGVCWPCWEGDCSPDCWLGDCWLGDCWPCGEGDRSPDCCVGDCWPEVCVSGLCWDGVCWLC